MKVEELAIKRFNRFGREALTNISERISLRAEARMKNNINYEASADCWISINTPQHWLTVAEKKVIHSISLALMLCTNPAEEARQRNLARVQERRERRKALSLAA
ncbi:TPA: hypothetical protein I7730_16250 [Vibrio vulnificus]|uniref:Uncharacterized protein n=1 Tax=Vibrio vulnificus TaxID=672 RepID=A0A8H9N1Z3_VIBVL|nr:hypothetical protein [Vibrio vulnificus]HAS8541336.1 hypothetical protein [Vibrio vulnificus]